MRWSRGVSGRSQVFIVFISVFVMKINYTKIKYKQIYENKFLGKGQVPDGSAIASPHPPASAG
ncbi:hypothetical protein GE543_22975 [Pseudomonas sp. SZ57]|nr:hypothetical protein [Pseudomonas sp. SZ57]